MDKAASQLLQLLSLIPCAPTCAKSNDLWMGDACLGNESGHGGSQRPL
jgi:hypothetical protein